MKKTRRTTPAAPDAVFPTTPAALHARLPAAVLTAVFTSVLTVTLSTGGLFAGPWHGNGIARAATPATAPARASTQPASAPPSKAVDALWTTPLTRPDGKPQSLAVYKGRPVVVNFWASWCAPCVKEMPELSALQREYAKKGVQFVGVGVDSATNVATFLKKVRIDYPIYVAGFGGTELARAFGDHTGGLPFTLVIDAKGAIRATKLGPVKPEELRRTLNTL